MATMMQDINGKRKFNVLTTGAGGYIGSHVVLELLADGHNVVAIDNFNNCAPYGKRIPESLRRVEQLAQMQLHLRTDSDQKTESENESKCQHMCCGKMTFYEVDCCDRVALEAVFEKHPEIDSVINFAGLKAVGESVREPLRYYSNNVIGVINILECMNKFDVKLFVFSSSATVYGAPQYLPVDERHPTGECSNPYGWTKYFIERMLKDICNASNENGDQMRCILLRYFNPVGAHSSGDIGEDPIGPPNNLMPYVAQVAVGRRPYLNIWGSDYPTRDGTGVRDYIHVVDLAKGHVAALQHLARSGQMNGHNYNSRINKNAFPETKDNSTLVYNLGSGTGHSVLEVVKVFERVSGRKLDYKFCERRAGDFAEIYACSRQAETDFGWKTEFDLEAMCRDTWRWQSKNPNGYLTPTSDDEKN